MVSAAVPSPTRPNLTIQDARMMITPHTLVTVSKHQVSCDLAGEVAILNLKNSGYYGLDQVGTRIWQFIGEPRPVSAIRDALVSEYEIDAEQCERDLIELLQSLATEGLVEITGEIAP
jgi:hypothetical protein